MIVRRAMREDAAAMTDVLRRSSGHPLFGLNASLIARADGRDDYLFQIADDRVAEVHLTFANRPERPPWPGCSLYESLDAWRKAKLEEYEQ